jgi:hypothetical protein
MLQHDCDDTAMIYTQKLCGAAGDMPITLYSLTNVNNQLSEVAATETATIAFGKW